MINYLLLPLNKYFQEVTLNQGKVLFLNDFIENFKSELSKGEHNTDSLTLTASMFQDISAPSNEPSSMLSGYIYNLEKSYLEIEIDLILSREYCLSLSQMFEIFESYLIDVITTFIFHNSTYLVKFEISEACLHLSMPLIREKLRTRYSRGISKQLIKLLRKNFPYYKEHESKNKTRENISEWFALLTELRHNIVHNRQFISKKLQAMLNQEQKNKIYKKNFDIKNTNNGTLIYLTKETFFQNLYKLNGFAYFIFKSLSIGHNLNPIYRRIS